MTRAVVVAVAVAVAVLGTLGGAVPMSAGRALAVSVPDRPAPIGGVGATVDVKVADNVFRPKKLTILPGTTVRWTNTGRNEHDVLPNKGKRFGIDELEPDAQYSFTFEKPGRYAYYCSFHGAPGVGQHATVRVVEDRPRGA